MEWFGSMAWVGLCLASGTRSVVAERPLEAVFPVDWRAVPMIEAVRDLARRLDVPYILDASVTDEMTARPVRLSATHLNGRQAFRWTVRAVGLDAVLVDGAMMIAPPDRLPASWRLAGTLSNLATSRPADLEDGGAGNSADLRWRAVLSAHADLAWVDSPLSRVTKDLSDQCAVDVIFHSRILADQPLVRLAGRGLTWSAVAKALEEQLDVTTRFDDGAIWVEPRSSAASRPALPGEPGTAALEPVNGTSVLSALVEIILVDAEAGKIQETLRKAAGINCRVDGPAGTKVESMTARGRLIEVLEGARLLEGWEWELGNPDEMGRPILLIHMKASGRFVP